ncbi:MAG: CvpA family protein [Cyclobacteriaceae bacterium]|nr:CvpA family protein [Cyclobacteriaceae bacterium]
MNVLDIILIASFIIGIFSGYQKGFLASLFSLAGIFFGILLGFKLMGVAMLKLSNYYNISEKILPYVAFGVVFIIVIIVVNILGKLVKSSIDKTVLGQADKWIGGALGLLKAMFMISVFFWIMSALSFEFPEHWVADSRLYPYTVNVAPTVTEWVGDIFPTFKDLFGSTE